MNAPDLHQLQRQVAALTRKVTELEAALQHQHRFDAAMPGITLHERRRFEFIGHLAKPRTLINFTATNTLTGTTITSDQFSAAQLERFAFRFARLPQPPSRKHWRGNRAAFGLMRDLFHQHGAIVRHYGRRWQWAVERPQRSEIAARIAAALSRQPRASESPRRVIG